ncbi:transcription cofactor vestigial-like protein 1 [Eublepharis macularius]|uniref:Transcription cofactor vestigial-like protein 1 n=1 Tax=Eublepharis macularius TaxID=481883 RepID=A0AA97LDE3_EUBMA|nr:transcription cofactor vestigial-like protein 1 [Eublepharis macularius]
MFPDMEEKTHSSKLSKNKQPVKTEWGTQYVVFTYFQGDINSVVDEHFSRALSTAKNPQDLSRKNKSEDTILKNDSHMTPHQWNFSPPWAKPYQTPPPLNLSSSDLHAAAPVATDPFQPSVLQGIPPPGSDLWHLPSGSHPNLTATSEYSSSVPELHMAQGSISDGKYGSLLGLLQQDRCPPSMQESTDSSTSCLTGSARLQNMSHSLTSGGGIQASDGRRDLYF